MQVTKNDLGKSQIELTVEIPAEEFKSYLEPAVKKISAEVKIDGFRPGHVPYEVLKAKIGEMTILEEMARLAINKTIGAVIKEHVAGQPVGEPQVNVSKLAPDNPLEYKAVLALLPEVHLGEYKNLKLKEEKIVVTPAEVEKTVNDLREWRAKEALSAEAVKDGDKAIVDIQMFLDNVPIDGGQSRDTAVLIGKDYLLPGFDKNLLGLKRGEAREFKLPYPTDFHDKNLAGKLVEFKVTAKEVYTRDLPEINDVFAEGLGLKNLEELKANITKSHEERKKQQTRHKMESDLLNTIVNKSRFGDIPEMLINNEGENMLRELEETVTHEGGKWNDYLSHLGKTRDQLLLDVAPDAVKRVKTSLVIRTVGQAENITASDEETDKQIEEMKKHYREEGRTDPELNTPAYRYYVKNILTSRKIIEKLVEWNIK
jgi:trigger factor